MVFSRDQAYIGVLIDDLVTKGTDSEPYRMFTSRAEYRLLLREDNADLRLSETGHRIGLAGEAAYQRFKEKKSAIDDLVDYLDGNQLLPDGETNLRLEALGKTPLKNVTKLSQILRRPEISLADIRVIFPEMIKYSRDVDSQVEVQIKYQGYVNRQNDMVGRFQKMEDVRLPEDIDYSQISGISREVCEKLIRIQPRSLGQASRISGITPAAITLLSFYLKKRKSVESYS